MKELPDEKTLLELLELAESAEQKAREMYRQGEAFAQKWENRLAARKQAATKHIENAHNQ
jgi:rubrerythrin